MKHLTQEDLTNAIQREPFLTISQVAAQINVPCYVVGGYVRDLFLDTPSKDIDIVCVGSGIELARAFSRAIGHKATLSVFRNFGTAQVKYILEGRNQAEEVEFVGARRESYTHNSRKPIVEDGTLQDDQLRRDFTINTLALSLGKDDYGRLLDPFDGLLDLEDRLIRTPDEPKRTFSDDPLRMMRAIRFATRLGFQISDETFTAIEASCDRIKIVSSERITDEINKIMLTRTPSCGFVLLSMSGLLPLVFPELAALEGVERIGGKTHKDNFYHTLEVLDNIARHTDNLYLRYAALLHDIGKPRTRRYDPVNGWTFHNHNAVGAHMVADIFRRMHLPLGEEMRYVRKLVSLHMRPIAIASDIVTDSAVRRLLFEAGNDIDDLMTLCEADITSKNILRRKEFMHNFAVVRRKLTDLDRRDSIRNFQPPVNGLEIMQTLNLPPCAVVGTIKNAIKDAILDGRIPNQYQAARDFMIQQARQLGLYPMEDQPQKG